MKIEKSQIFIAVGGILVGALVYKYFYSNKVTASNFLGFDMKDSEFNATKGIALEKLKKTYLKMIEAGVSPADAIKKLAGKIQAGKSPKKYKVLALNTLRELYTKDTGSMSLDGMDEFGYDGLEEDDDSEETASFLGFGKKKNQGVVKGVVKDGASAYGETAQKVGKAYGEYFKKGGPIFAAKQVAGKIRRSRMSRKEKQNALAQLRNISTATDNFDGSLGL